MIAKETKRICLVIPSLQAGGMERVMSELAGYLSKINQLETHLIIYGRKPEIFYQIPENILIHKLPFVFNNKYRLFFTIKTLFYLRKEIKKIRPDTVLSFGEYWNNFVLMALTGLEFPVFVSDRWRPDKIPRFPHNILRKILYPRAKGIIVQTYIAYEIYRKFLLRSNIKVIANPIRNILPNKLNKKENIILSAGRLIETKHFDRLIRIFLKLNAPGWKLIIAGGDAVKQKNYEKLKNLIHNFNAQDRILLPGYVNNMDTLYQKSKIFAFTSSSEGFPNVIGEALSTGLPVVAYDCIAGPSEMIQDGINGFLIPVFKDEIFAQKLQLLIDNEIIRTRMSINALHSTEKYNINNIGKEYLDFILE
jgi:GalNAc-alpha-(1->4)-GalNAc-alpha-(1->3)-diNAcBac-PP-undecaprenol alpha-1,4-N-acetyl-D-galactosaminyltransferase